MTTRRFFNCNLCGVEISKGRSGFGLKWGKSDDDVEITSLPDSEYHICDPCLSGLRSLTYGGKPETEAAA